MKAYLEKMLLGDLTGENQKQYYDYIKYWVDQMSDSNAKSVNEVKESWYPDIYRKSDSARTGYRAKRTDSGIQYWQTIKIRKLLQKIYESQGFPIRFARDLNFTMFVGIAIPTGFTVHKLKTIQLWLENRSSRWREVYISWKGMEYDDYLYLVVGYVPIFGNAIVNTIRARIYEESARKFKIYKNLAYRSALNDKTILANWDYICQELIDNGY